MQAVLCRHHGPPESLELVDCPSPMPAAGEVVVEVHAAGVNFPDTLIIENRYQFKPALPFSPGSEVAGSVARIGPGLFAAARRSQFNSRIFTLRNQHSSRWYVSMMGPTTFSPKPGSSLNLLLAMPALTASLPSS